MCRGFASRKKTSTKLTLKYPGEFALTASSRSLILLTSYDPGWLRIVEHLAIRAKNQGRLPIVLDTTSSSPSPVGTFNQKALRFFGLRSPGHNAEEVFSQLGAKWMSSESIARTGSGASLPSKADDLLNTAVDSELFSLYRTDSPNLSKRRIRKMAACLRREAVDLYGAVENLISDGGVAEVVIPNGRLPKDRMAALAAQQASVPTVFYEKGEGENRAFIQPYSIQARVASQQSASEILTELSSDAVSEIAHKWLNSRRPSINSQNEFSAGWNSSLPPALLSKLRNRPNVGFFTSSQDEFQSLGPEWKLHEWKDQFEAFEAIVNTFEGQGFNCILRVHPNLAGKSHEYFKREKKRIRQLRRNHPMLHVVWHDERVNTYELLRYLDAVVVWDSTVGLEASALGIPVWTCAATRYGLTADIKEVLSSSELENSDFKLWRVDTMGAKKFIAYLTHRDEDLLPSQNCWVDWDPANPPLGVKIAAHLNSGGAPSVRDALLATLDVWRHRRFKTNLVMLQAKVGPPKKKS